MYDNFGEHRWPTTTLAFTALPVDITPGNMIRADALLAVTVVCPSTAKLCTNACMPHVFSSEANQRGC